MRKRGFVVLFTLAALICFVLAILQFRKEQNAGDIYDLIREEAVLTPEATPTPTDTPTPTPTPEETQTPTPTPDEPTEPVPIDFEELWKTCPDAYAWIRMPNTNVDYPVMQKEGDDGFYLSHAANGAAEFAGAIYSEGSVNGRDFKDKHTVLYGHNMLNGTMFRTLHYYEDRDFFANNRDFVVYLPDRVLHYKIYAAYNYNDRHLLNTRDMNDAVDFRDYMDEILSIRAMDACIAEDYVYTDKDKILTLSTCNNWDDQRYLVQAVLVKSVKGVPDPVRNEG